MDLTQMSVLRIIGIVSAIGATICFVWSAHLDTVHSREFDRVKEELFNATSKAEMEYVDGELDRTARIATRSFWVLLLGMGLLVVGVGLWVVTA